MCSQRPVTSLSIRTKNELKPKIEPTYKRESPYWLRVTGTLSMLGSVVLAVVSAIAGQELMTLLGIVLSAITSSFVSMLKGDYALAVKLVNSTNVEEWSYNGGVAVMKLSDEILVILDTKLKKLYLSRQFSFQRYPLRSGGVKLNIKFITLVKPNIVDLGSSREFKKARVLRGVIEVPSIKSEREVMRIFGTFLEVKLRGNCLKELGACLEKLIRTL